MRQDESDWLRPNGAEISQTVNVSHMLSKMSKGQNALVIPRKERIAESKEVNKEGSARKNKGKWAAGRRKESRGPKEKRGANERGKLRGFSKAQREKEES